ncbi:hypothetical protein niasHT_003800 [Heterodera trifolii]|uniref:C2H2-type domain-containing protein n=1 Tax=Heterodera trifolii TaxID=157864 RepID=A0ABD2LUT7_9BILA
MAETFSLLSPTHLLNETSLNLRCPYCPKKFLTNTEANSHIDPCLKSRPYPCTNCSRRFKSAQNLSQHERIHTNVRPYNCQYCEKNFTQKSHLQQHERIHTGEPAFSCRYCGETFNIYSSKIQHEKNICSLHEALDKQKENSSEKNGFAKIVRERSPIGSANSHCKKWPYDKVGNTFSTEQNGTDQTIIVTGTSINILPQRLSLDDPSLRLIAKQKTPW